MERIRDMAQRYKTVSLAEERAIDLVISASTYYKDVRAFRAEMLRLKAMYERMEAPTREHVEVTRDYIRTFEHFYLVA